jgi:hypothetical protein
LYGKAAIVKSILEAERGSKLFVNEQLEKSFDPDRFADTWLVKLMYMLGRRIAREDVRQIFDRVSFIVFNYDRCIEHFLFHELKAVYGISDREAQSILDDLHITHPYGVVSDSIPFGLTRANYRDLAQGIKTYTEQAADADAVNEIAIEIARAECIVFLGFAYHSQNMLMLRPPDQIQHKPVYGSAFKMSDADVEVVSHNLTSFFTPNVSKGQRKQLIKLENMTSADLFDHYAKSLSGGD